MIEINKILTIAISTISNNPDILLKKILLELPNISKNISFLIVLQGNISNLDFIDYPKDRINIIFSETTGLSLSRNIAINNINTPWLWFQDDDIVLNVGVLGKLIDSLMKTKSDVFLTKIISLESKKHYYKNYSYYKYSKKRIALRASSIEIIVRKKFLINNKVKFDTRLGLGSPYPCGEENLFLLKIIKNGGKVEVSNVAPCFHTTLKNNRKNISTGHYVARGVLLQEFSFFLAFFIAIKWSINKRNSHNIFTVFRFIIQGYFK